MKLSILFSCLRSIYLILSVYLYCLLLILFIKLMYFKTAKFFENKLCTFFKICTMFKFKYSFVIIIDCIVTGFFPRTKSKFYLNNKYITKANNSL